MRYFICSMIILTTLTSPLFASEQYKTGWNQKEQSNATEGCIAAIIAPQMQYLRDRFGNNEADIPPKLKEKIPLLKKEAKRYCSCMTEKLAKNWTLSEFKDLVINKKQERLDFANKMACSGECPLPFNIPVDCSNNAN